jgi:hypothetical protein
METKPFQWPDSSEADGPDNIILAVLIRQEGGQIKARVSCGIPIMTAEQVGEVFGNAVTAAVTSGGLVRQTMSEEEKVAFTRGFDYAIKQTAPRFGDGTFATKTAPKGGE